MRTAKGGRGIRAEAWGFNLAETYPNQGLIIPVAWRERSKQRSVPQGSESYRGKEPTREMLLFGADRANNDASLAVPAEPEAGRCLPPVARARQPSRPSD